MPKRHNNHQIEDASRRKFDTLLPDAWVSRQKPSDYGIDLEVEIFNEDGSATGLMFYVQLRGTDDIDKETITQLSIDQLQYFRQLDIPTLLVRFCRPTGTFYCKWHHEIHTKPEQERQQSITVRFSGRQRWDDETLNYILTDLKIARYAARMPPSGRISVSLDAVDLGPSKHFEFKSALLKVTAVYGAVCSADNSATDEQLPIHVAYFEGSILVSCGRLTNIEVPYGGKAEDLPSALLYAICIVCFDLKCVRQAQDAARSILLHRIKANDKWTAFRAACALQASPSELVNFALLNSLEDSSLLENPLVTMMLVGASGSALSRDWLQHWFATVENFALKNDMLGPAAATNYNRGNAALQTTDFSKAVRYYNKARKLRPEYLEAKYFLQELGGALYLMRRYQPASCLYAKAITEESSPLEWHRLGDAQLLSGRIEAAIPSFERSIKDQKASPEMLSSSLKLSLCHWMREKYKESPPIRRYGASQMLKLIEAEDTQNESEYRRVLQEVCALDPVANFNVGVSCASDGKFSDALYHFVICGVQCPHDHEAWKNAMICSWHLGLEAFIIVLSAAYAHNALESYSYFRGHIAEQGVSDEAIEMLDALVGELDDPTTVSKSFSDWTQRILTQSAS